MRDRFKLSGSNPIQNIGITRYNPIAIIVENNTGSAILIREGSQENPSIRSADHFIAAASIACLPVNAQEFSVAFADTTLVANVQGFVSGLANFAIIEIIGEGETVPTFGAISFASLSLSQLIPITAFSGPTTSPVIDIGAFGGLCVWINPSGASGQGVVQVYVSETGASGTFVLLDTRAIWTGIPVIWNVPRVARYAQIFINAVAISGEPTPAGSYGVRASLQEVQVISYNPQSNAINQAYNVANLTETNKSFVTVGLPAISVIVQETSGAGIASELIIETSTSATGPWYLVTFREQNIGAGSAFASVYRTIGTLGPFTRVRLLNTGIAGALVGNLIYSIAPIPDNSGLLTDILRALGDVSAPVNVNQDIYHELDNARLALASIDGKTSTLLVSANSIANNTFNTNSNASAIAGSVASIDAKSTNLAAIAASDASIDAKSTNLAAIAASDANINASLIRWQTGSTGVVAITAAPGAPLNTWNLSALALSAGFYVVSGKFGITCPAALQYVRIGIGIGNGGGGFSGPFVDVLIPMPNIVNGAGYFEFDLTTNRSPGNLLAAPNTFLYFLVSSPGNVQGTINVVS